MRPEQLLTAGFLLCTLTSSVSAQNYSPACPVAGRYSVTGKDPGSSVAYHGDAVITANGVGCYMKWGPPNSSDGSGTYENGVLTIHFAIGNHTGVARYSRNGDGSFTGEWWNDDAPDARGSEMLFPISLAGP